METRNAQKFSMTAISLLAAFLIETAMLLPAEVNAASKPKKPAQRRNIEL